MTEPRDCKHGRLARSCETCAMEEEIDDLKYELGVAREAQQCECSTDDACRFARERDALASSDAALREELGNVKAGLEHYRNAAIEALVSTEREACAKVCESLTMNIDVFDTMDAVTPINLRCAKAIRSRTDETGR